MSYEVVIGLEIHTQLKTKSKMFCRCPNVQSITVEDKKHHKNGQLLEEPNIRICPICSGQPGTLPTINEQAVKWTILTGLALNCQIAKLSKFDRKNYFYPDLPKGYQISQYDLPFSQNGYLKIEVAQKDQKSYYRKVSIERIHLEEDAGKLIHPERADYSLVDLNRAGTPLMEIVTRPDLKSAQEAKIFMQELRSILRYLNVSQANMEEGNLRCDANISIKPKGAKKLGQKTEIKNMNSFKAVERALAYEADRQIEILKEKGKIIHETRGWDESAQKTISQRSKEEAYDYRYFPEPDLPPIQVGTGNKLLKAKIDLDEIKACLPELPAEKRERFQKEYGLSAYDAYVLTAEPEMARFFEKAIENISQVTKSTEILKKRAKKISNWVTSELVYLLTSYKVTINQCKIKPADLAFLVELVASDKISNKIAKDVLLEVFKKGKRPQEIIKSKNLKQISGKQALAKIIEDVVKENSQPVNDYKRGRKQAMSFLIGQVMKKTRGQANPEVASKLLKEKLESS